MVVDNLYSGNQSDMFLSAGTAPLSAGLNEDHPSGDTVLKKAAIIVVGSAAVILAASPLALADSFDHSPQCVSARQAVDNSVAQGATATTPVAALLGAAANIGVPVNAQTQAPIASCNNIEDVLDLNVRDNFQDNSKSIDKSRTVNRDSFNS
jgi:hypothetical protein